MAEAKTKPTGEPVADFLARVEPPGRRADALAAAAMLAEVTGEPAVMWGSSIVGFGSYVTPTRPPGQAPMIGFSPRKSELVFYVMSGFEGREDLLARLGKHRSAVSCLYVKRLDDVDAKVLRELAARSVEEMRRRHPNA